VFVITRVNRVGTPNRVDSPSVSSIHLCKVGKHPPGSIKTLIGLGNANRVGNLINVFWTIFAVPQSCILAMSPGITVAPPTCNYTLL
jgi:hypothetical protein